MTASPLDSVDRLQLTDLLTPTIARLSGAALGTAGFFVIGSALALTVEFEGLVYGLATAPVWALGLAALLVGPFTYNGRGWAAVLAALVAPSAALVCVAWALFAVVTLSFVPVLALAVGASGVAALLAPFAVVPSLRVSRVRRALLA